jgi:hypothetical protein
MAGHNPQHPPLLQRSFGRGSLRQHRTQRDAAPQPSMERRRSSAPKKLKRLDAKVRNVESEIEALRVEMLSAGGDTAKLAELGEKRGELLKQADALYKEMEALEGKAPVPQQPTAILQASPHAAPAFKRPESMSAHRSSMDDWHSDREAEFEDSEGEEENEHTSSLAGSQMFLDRGELLVSGIPISVEAEMRRRMGFGEEHGAVNVVMEPPGLENSFYEQAVNVDMIAAYTVLVKGARRALSACARGPWRPRLRAASARPSLLAAWQASRARPRASTRRGPRASTRTRASATASSRAAATRCSLCRRPRRRSSGSEAASLACAAAARHPPACRL